MFLVTCATALALAACGSSSTGSSPNGTTSGSSSGGNGTGNNGSSGGTSSGSTAGSGTATSSGTGGTTGSNTGGIGSGTTTGTTGGTSTTSTGGTTTGGTSGGTSSGGEGGTNASRCPGYAAPPAAGTTITLAGTSATNAEKILPLGCMHLLSNRWSDPMSAETLFINNSGGFGWTWNRGTTGPTTPNYPEIEFGVNPWGMTMYGDLTNISTTDLLPAQVSNIHSASMTVNINANIQNPGTGWNLAFEMWLAPVDPTKATTNPSFEIMVFFGNQPSYYPTMPGCDASATKYNCGTTVTDGTNTYKLFYANANWGTPAYTYLQFRDSADGSSGTFNGKLDIYKFLQYANPAGNLYLTRFELGDETSQGGQGTTTINSISFEVNGTTETALMQY
jgi:hypothetical protein